MIISGVTKDELYYASRKVWEEKEPNVRFRDGTPEALNYAGTRWRVRLVPIDGQLGGVLRGLHDGRRLHTSCWHVHGWFFERLPKSVRISANGVVVERYTWRGWNAGNMMLPVMQSDRCDCMNDGVRFIPFGKPVKSFNLAGYFVRNIMRDLELGVQMLLDSVGEIPVEIVPIKLPLAERSEMSILSRFKASRLRYGEGNTGY